MDRNGNLSLREELEARMEGRLPIRGFDGRMYYARYNDDTEEMEEIPGPYEEEKTLFHPRFGQTKLNRTVQTEIPEWYKEKYGYFGAEEQKEEKDAEPYDPEKEKTLFHPRFGQTKLNRTVQTEIPGWYKAGYQRPDFELMDIRGRGFRPDEWRESGGGGFWQPENYGIYDSYKEDNSVFRGQNQLPMTPEAVVKPNMSHVFQQPYRYRVAPEAEKFVDPYVTPQQKKTAEEKLKMLIEEAFDETMNQEGNKEFPYLDPRKIITIGVGHNINDYDEFVKVFSPYYPIEVIKDAYGRMVAKREDMENKGKSFNIDANHYKGVAEIEIPREVLAEEYRPKARELMTSWLKKVEGLKREGVLPPDFDFFQQPKAVQLALFDMVYNLGPNKMMPVYMKNGKNVGYPRLFDALARGDFEEMALQSERNGVGKRRNIMVAEKLKEAAEIKKRLRTPAEQILYQQSW